MSTGPGEFFLQVLTPATHSYKVLFRSTHSPLVRHQHQCCQLWLRRRSWRALSFEDVNGDEHWIGIGIEGLRLCIE